MSRRTTKQRRAARRRGEHVAAHRQTRMGFGGWLRNAPPSVLYQFPRTFPAVDAAVERIRAQTPRPFAPPPKGALAVFDRVRDSLAADGVTFDPDEMIREVCE